jgi:hypothetical protein
MKYCTYKYILLIRSVQIYFINIKNHSKLQDLMGVRQISFQSSTPLRLTFISYCHTERSRSVIKLTNALNGKFVVHPILFSIGRANQRFKAPHKLLNPAFRQASD